jgi:hypothetical protein
MLFKYIYRKYKSRFYDELVLEFMGQVPDAISEPVIDFLADKKVLFEKFLSIQAYHIQRARVQSGKSGKSADFYDGALMIIKAFLVAVNKKVIDRTTVIPTVDPTIEVKDSMDKVTEFLKGFTDKK